MESNLSLILKELAEQNVSSSDDFEDSRIVMVTKEDEEVKQYVDDMFDCKISESQKYLGNFGISSSIALFPVSLLGFYVARYSFLPTATLEYAKDFICGEITFFTMSFVSTLGSIIGIVLNKSRKLNSSEKIISKKLKLYLSYLMLTINIGLNISNLNINYEKFARLPTAVTLEKKKITRIQVLKDLNNPFSDPNHLVTTKEAEVDLLMEAFQNNPFLDDIDIETALSLRKYLEDNIYCDYEELYQIYATVIVIHDPQRNTIKGNIRTAASNNLTNNIITIYSEKGADYSDDLEHELIHDTGYLDNMMLNEGMTSLLRAEYRNHYWISDAYYDHVLMTKIFCEFITPEKMLEAYSMRDMSIIKEEMLKINPNEEHYDNLMSAMQEYAEVFDNGVDDQFRKKYKNIKMQFYTLLTPYLNFDCLTKEQFDRIMMALYYLGDGKIAMYEVYKTYFNQDSNMDRLAPSLDWDTIFMPNNDLENTNYSKQKKYKDSVN